MCACEIWTITKAENQRIDVFELWCWRRLLRLLWTARRSNLSVLKEISPEYSLKGLMLKLKLQYFGHLMWRTNSLEKRLQYWVRLKAGAEEDDRGWDGWWHHWLNGHEFEQAPGIGDGQGSLAAAVHGVAKHWIRLSNWTELNWLWEKLGLVLIGRAVLSKSLIQFSVDRQGCVPSLLFDLRPKLWWR